MLLPQYYAYDKYAVKLLFNFIVLGGIMEKITNGSTVIKNVSDVNRFLLRLQTDSTEKDYFNTPIIQLIEVQKTLAQTIEENKKLREELANALIRLEKFDPSSYKAPSY